MKRFAWALVAVALIPLLTLAIARLENGPSRADGRSLAEIIGSDPAHATTKHLMALDKSELRQAFLAASTPPDLTKLVGDFEGRLVERGLFYGAAALYTHHAFGPAPWRGKSFEAGGGPKDGSNIFLGPAPDRDASRVKARRMRVSIGPSAFDSQPSILLDYSPYNGGIVGGMRDELREVRPGLYIGMGSIALSGGHLNPAPFLLYAR